MEFVGVVWVHCFRYGRALSSVPFFVVAVAIPEVADVAVDDLQVVVVQGFEGFCWDAVCAGRFAVLQLADCLFYFIHGDWPIKVRHLISLLEVGEGVWCYLFVVE